MHIQDGALFYPDRLDLAEPEAERRCQSLIDNARRFGGVLTCLWHDRSHGPERFWGDFYVRLVETLKSLDGWFGAATQVVSWFRQRRHVRFEQVEVLGGARVLLRYDGEEIEPPLKIRFYGPSRRRNDGESVGGPSMESIDVSWNGKSVDELELQIASRFSSTLRDTALCSSL
jgi:hypothetical protein